MRTRTISTAITACLVALLATGALFYIDKQSAVANDKESSERFEFGAEIEHPFGEKTVKGAPFSAQVFFENTQTLANGVHFSRKLTGALYRDSEGRTRQEMLREGPPEIVLINDPVGGALYKLHMFDHAAVKVNVRDTSINRELEEARYRDARLNRELEEKVRREIEERERMEKSKMTAEREKKEIEPERRVESLGVQAFEGVQAEVKRVTLTVPAGIEGNDRAYEIVSERWYSPELRVVVMSKRSDPRTGDTIYRLTNINRTEPARSLFEAPSDFTVAEEKTQFRKKER